jgi:homoserine O-acetyltransferase/O-succinyltransferase
MKRWVPLASVPAQIAGRNRMRRKMIMDTIRSDPAWNGGDCTAQPPGLEGAVRILVLMAGSTVQAQKDAPNGDAADALLVQQMKSRSSGVDANDMLYYFDASREYDPSAALDRIKAPLLAINSADDLINPPELGDDAARAESGAHYETEGTAVSGMASPSINSTDRREIRTRPGLSGA